MKDHPATGSREEGHRVSRRSIRPTSSRRHMRVVAQEEDAGPPRLSQYASGFALAHRWLYQSSRISMRPERVIQGLLKTKGH